METVSRYANEAKKMIVPVATVLLVVFASMLLYKYFVEADLKLDKEQQKNAGDPQNSSLPNARAPDGPTNMIGIGYVPPKGGTITKKKGIGLTLSNTFHVPPVTKDNVQVSVPTKSVFNNAAGISGKVLPPTINPDVQFLKREQHAFKRTNPSTDIRGAPNISAGGSLTCAEPIITLAKPGQIRAANNFPKPLSALQSHNFFKGSPTDGPMPKNEKKNGKNGKNKNDEKKSKA